MASNQKKHILIVDDSPMDLEFIAGILQEDYTLSTAAGGQQALEILSQGLKPEVVILDIIMPGMSGFEICQTMLDKNNDMDIIFVSSNDSTSKVLEGYSAGAIDFISKPFDAALLQSKVTLAIKNREKLSQLKSTNESVNKLAMDAMTHAGELGIIINYQRQCFLVDNIYDLCEALVEAISQFGLSCCVRMNEGEKVAANSNAGVVNELEAQLMARASYLGERLFNSNMRTFIRYEDVVILIKNMPVDDEEKMGRLRDILMIIAESAQSRIKSFELMHGFCNNINYDDKQEMIDEIRTKVIGLVNSLENVYESFEKDKVKYANKSVNLANAIINKFEEAFSELNLNEEQEKTLLKIIESVVDNSLEPQEEDAQLDSQLKHIANQLTSLQVMH